MSTERFLLVVATGNIAVLIIADCLHDMSGE